MKRDDSRFLLFRRKMELAGLPVPVIDSFGSLYARLLSGDAGMLPESSIRPLEAVQGLDDLGTDSARTGQECLSRTVMLKLNGGLGTSMGLQQAKSRLVAKNGLTFLDIIIRQAHQRKVPLLLMNSFATQKDSLEILRSYPAQDRLLPAAFLQHKVPKVDRDTLGPVEWPSEPELEWCPPGHGDLYLALFAGGLLDRLLARGFRYAFVSNADNLGASLDERILGFLVDRGLDFLMEVTRRTGADRKGGHLARDMGDPGRLVLRESAQCPDQDFSSFQDIRRHRFFNTNNLWLSLESLSRLMQEQGFPSLPMICNRKTLDPRDADSRPVIQLETAMGAAISVFRSSDALEVPRSRFFPVKTCSDLTLVRSDSTILESDFTLRPNYPGEVPPRIELDPRFYGLIDDLEARFPHGIPSLTECRSLEVRGDFRFGRSSRVLGDALLVNTSPAQYTLPDNLVIEGEYRV